MIYRVFNLPARFTPTSLTPPPIQSYSSGYRPSPFHFPLSLQDVFQIPLLRVGEGLREDDVEADDEVAALAAVLGTRHARTDDATLRVRVEDFWCAEGVLSVVERLDHHRVSGECIQQRDGVVVYQVV